MPTQSPPRRKVNKPPPRRTASQNRSTSPARRSPPTRSNRKVNPNTKDTTARQSTRDKRLIRKIDDLENSQPLGKYLLTRLLILASCGIVIFPNYAVIKTNELIASYNSIEMLPDIPLAGSQVYGVYRSRNGVSALVEGESATERVLRMISDEDTADLTVKGNAISQAQVENAQIILDVGIKEGASDEMLMVAIATSIQESGLENLDYGDRDSQGLFQQRESMDWGTIAQITNPAFAAKSFFRGIGTNIGLLDTKPEDGDIFVRSANVQRPQEDYRDKPRQWEQEAEDIVQILTE